MRPTFTNLLSCRLFDWPRLSMSTPRSVTCHFCRAWPTSYCCHFFDRRRLLLHHESCTTKLLLSLLSRLASWAERRCASRHQREWLRYSKRDSVRKWERRLPILCFSTHLWLLRADPLLFTPFMPLFCRRGGFESSFVKATVEKGRDGWGKESWVDLSTSPFQK